MTLYDTSDPAIRTTIRSEEACALSDQEAIMGDSVSSRTILYETRLQYYSYSHSVR